MSMEISYGGGFDQGSLDLYGRRAFVFRVHQVLSFSEAPVYSQDMVDREVVHVRFAVSFVLTGANGGLPIPAVGGGGAAPGVGIATADIDQMVRPLDGTALYSKFRDMFEILNTPRLPLTIRINGNLYLKVPQGLAGSVNAGLVEGNDNTYRCDARNGPMPIRATVNRFSGLKSSMCVWECETWISRPLGYNNAPNSDQPIVLSHRWSEEQVVDSMHFTSRTIQGRVVFAKNVLTRNGWQPDDFRNFLLRSIPNNTKRELVRSKCDSSGTSCDYTIVDKVPPENLGAISEILDFECWIRKGFQTAPGIMSIPLFHCDIDITLRGRPQTARRTLVLTAMNAVQLFGFTAAAADRVGAFARQNGVAIFAPGSSPCYRFEQKVNMAKREAGVSVGFIAGRDLISDIVNWLVNDGQLLNLNFTEFLPPITSVPNAFDRPLPDNPAPRFGGGFSDYYFGRILTQIPNDTSSTGNIGAPPARSLPLGPIQRPTRQPSLDPLNPTNEQAP
jgi:hypothetical protein